MKNLFLKFCFIACAVMMPLQAAADECYVRGDADGDGVITIKDVTLIVDYLLAGQWPTQEFVVNDVPFTMVTVQGGTFMMGSPNPENAHQVTLSTFSIGETEVTRGLWKAVMGYMPWSVPDTLMELPIGHIYYSECLTFIDKLNEITGLTFRLPTEAEWEYAARGGMNSRGYLYAGSDDVDEVAWNPTNCSSAQPVGLKKPNELGLYDMSGNVWEMTKDWYGNYGTEPEVNPTGPDTPTVTNARRCRGGGYWSSDSTASSCTVFTRGMWYADRRFFDLGFRLVLVME